MTGDALRVGVSIAIEGFALNIDQGAVVSRDWPLVVCAGPDRWSDTEVRQWVRVVGTVVVLSPRLSLVDAPLSMDDCQYQVGLPSPLPPSVLNRIAADPVLRPPGATVGDVVSVTGVLKLVRGRWYVETDHDRYFTDPQDTTTWSVDRILERVTMTGALWYVPSQGPVGEAETDPREAAGGGTFYLLRSSLSPPG